MSESSDKIFKAVKTPRVMISTGIGGGVFWHVWTLYGFWWGVLYGLFWQSWVGYRLAVYLLGGS